MSRNLTGPAKLARKLGALLLAMVMVLALGIGAYASDATSDGYTLTITNTTEGHTYSVYQIFSGELSEDQDTGELVLSDIEWSSGVDGDSLLSALQTDETLGSLFVNCETAADVAEVLCGDDWTAAYTEIFAGLVVENLGKATEIDVASEAGSTKITGLAAGYYIVVETSESVPDKETYTEYIIQVVGNTEIEVKSGTVTSDKDVIDTNDSTGETSDWQETADHDIGDSISYRLTGTLPSNYSSYEGYYYQFTDTMCAGLTLDENGTGSSVYVTVLIDREEYKLDASDYTVSVNASSATDGSYVGGTTFTVTIDDLTEVISDAEGNSITIDADTIIYVYYTATLNDNAVIGSEGNPNVSYLTYSNNPNTAQGGATDETGDTPEVTNIVFTYEVDVTKVDENDEKLTGAGFTLYKYDKDEGDYIAVGDELTGDEMTEFTWKGLDDGEYKLVETTTPTRYNTMDDLYFTIEAEHNNETLTLTSLSVDVTGGDSDLEANVTFGVISGYIVNVPGSKLPTTGGMGTTALYVVGILLVLGAGLTLIVRRRMSTGE